MGINMTLNSLQKIRFIRFQRATTIGIASEILRLALARSVMCDECIVPTPTRWKIFLKNKVYPSVIYKAITAPRIVELDNLPFYARYLRVFFWLLMPIRKYSRFKLGMAETTVAGQDGIYVASAELFNKITEHRSHHGALRLAARSIRGFGPVTLKDNYAEGCTQTLKKLGIDSKMWFVCLHVRSSAFHKDSAYYRNSDFETYRSAINHIISSGGIVVRLGDAVPGLVKFPQPGLIDYPNSQWKSELMDIFLISRCRFFIGTLSGVLDTAYLMGKPTLCVNSIHFDLRSSNPHDLVLYKRIRRRADGRDLTVMESLESCSDILSADWHLRYEFVDNTSECILKALLEFICILESNWTVTPRQVRARRKLIRERIKYAADRGDVHSMLNASIAFSRCQIADCSLIDSEPGF